MTKTKEHNQLELSKISFTELSGDGLVYVLDHVQDPDQAKNCEFWKCTMLSLSILPCKFLL